MQDFYIGVDIGGTSTKCGLVDLNGQIIAKAAIKTEVDASAEAQSLTRLIKNTINEAHASISSTIGIGIGIPGLIDTARGVVLYNNNLRWRNFDIVEQLKQNFDTPIKIANDANAAALGEAKFGAGAKYKDSIFVTLGTGVGGGIVLDKKLFEGADGAGAEIGHMIIVKDGLACSCGNKGCLEAYASATAVASRAKLLMKDTPDCYLWKRVGSDISKVSAKMVFDNASKDINLGKIVEEFYDYLATGLINLANIFRPQVILIGGGLSAQGEKMAKELQQRLDKGLYGGKIGPQVKVLLASLSNDAGIIGAASLCM